MITIEVTSEDGTIKNYLINTTRLSSCDASLSGLSISPGILFPPFNSTCTLYASTNPCHISTVEVKPIAPDKGIGVVIRDNPNSKPLQLNYGETYIYVDVTSPDKTTSKTYQIIISKANIPWHITTVIENSNIYSYSCPVCLAIFHCPKSIFETKPKHVFCKSCIDELTRTTKRDPLNGKILTGDWLVNEPSLEETLTELNVYCVFSRYGCNEKPKLVELGCHMKQCEFRLCYVEKSEELAVNKVLEEKMKVIKVEIKLYGW